jgi:enterochelin esterase-like enzyme
VHVRRSLAWLAQSSDTAGSAIHGDRDVRIDFLRGLFVVAMVIDHVAGASWLYLITGGNRFYASAAEGFVFVSGLVAGLTYHRLIARDGLGPVLGRILERAVQLYVLCIGLTLAFIPLSEYLDLPWAQDVDLRDPVQFVVSVLTLHRTYYMVDVPLLYALLLLVSPVAVVLLAQGRSVVVLVLSWLLWMTCQLFPAQAAVPWAIAGNNAFNFAAWQVLFFTGLVIGYHRDRLSVALRWLPKRVVLGLSLLSTSLLIAAYVMQNVVLGALVHGGPDPGRAQEALLVSLVGKTDLRAGRVFAFACVFTVLYLLVTAWWPTLRRVAGWLFVPLGQHALYAYTVHVALAVVAALALRAVGQADSGPARANAAIQLASVLLIWAVVQFKPGPITSAARKWGVAAPAAIAAGLLLVLPQLASAPVARGSGGAAQASSDTALLARAYGTAVPSTEEPEVVAGTLAQPRPQPDGQAPGTAIHPPASGVGVLNGTLWEPEFYSVALNAEERYFVYLPPDYREAGRRYPALYLLHGAGGDKSEWVNYGLIQAADRGMSTGALPSMVIVLPQGDLGYWVNHANDGPAWGDYLVNDVVRHIDSTYRTLPDRDHRAIGGLSMGGWGALHAAFTRPDVFGVVGAHAPSLRADEGSLAFLGMDRAFALDDPVEIAAAAPGLGDLEVWLDVSDHDPWGQRALVLKQRLDVRRIDNTWRVFPGDHGGAYWHDHLAEYLDFYGQALSQP